MSGTSEYILQCDGTSSLGCPSGAFIAHDTAKKARAEAKAVGWRLGYKVGRGKDHRTPDLCSRCRKRKEGTGPRSE